MGGQSEMQISALNPKLQTLPSILFGGSGGLSKQDNSPDGPYDSHNNSEY